MARTVLITGGTGYLGQFVVQAFLDAGYRVVATHHSAQPAELGAVWQRVDLATGEGLEPCLETAGPKLAAVVNCAAVSTPAFCEANPAAAAAINVPDRLLAALQSRGVRPRFIHISTDHVYAGVDAPAGGWTETHPTQPINAYGRSKLAAEHAVQEEWENYVILRPSVILGPAPPCPVGRQLFLQFVCDALASQTPTKFFTDEWRTPSFVTDIAQACVQFTDDAALVTLEHRVFNIGGPERLSREQMARRAAAAGNWAQDAIQAVPVADVPRACPTPVDIAMDSSRLAAALGTAATPYDQVLHAAGVGMAAQ